MALLHCTNAKRAVISPKWCNTDSCQDICRRIRMTNQTVAERSEPAAGLSAVWLLVGNPPFADLGPHPPQHEIVRHKSLFAGDGRVAGRQRVCDSRLKTRLHRAASGDVHERALQSRRQTAVDAAKRNNAERAAICLFDPSAEDRCGCRPAPTMSKALRREWTPIARALSSRQKTPRAWWDVVEDHRRSSCSCRAVRHPCRRRSSRRTRLRAWRGWCLSRTDPNTKAQVVSARPSDYPARSPAPRRPGPAISCPAWQRLPFRGEAVRGGERSGNRKQ